MGRKSKVLLQKELQVTRSLLRFTGTPSGLGEMQVTQKEGQLNRKDCCCMLHHPRSWERIRWDPAHRLLAPKRP